MADTLEARLSAAIERLIGRPVVASDRFGLAVSGGGDSMALLGLTARIWPGQVEAASVDHGLRAAARDEAAMVAHWCAAQGIAHAILEPRKPIIGNLQAQARAVRYGLLESWCAERGLNWLLTAHHADDQIETMLLRLNRGAGVGGLASIRPRRGALLRPLLGECRESLRAWCREQSIPFVDDPSNCDVRFDRARLRAKLTGLDLIDPTGLARSTEALSEAQTALDWMTDHLEASHVQADGDVLTLRSTEFPRDLLRRLLLRMIARINPQAEPPRGPSVDQAIIQLLDGKKVTLTDCVVVGGSTWAVRRAPPRRPV